VDEVFTVMEKASWHHFQLLTKRPKEMAAYTAKRYATRPPPPNVWLGTTIENQALHDDRMPHMKDVKAAVRWISCEPLLTEVKLDLKGIDWVVVGGESGSMLEARKMHRAWAIKIRDQCTRTGVPFFFKQWGDFGEDGKPNTSKEGENDPPPQLDGAVHREYPMALP
jgi:protein gp37